MRECVYIRPDRARLEGAETFAAAAADGRRVTFSILSLRRSALRVNDRYGCAS